MNISTTDDLEVGRSPLSLSVISKY